METTYKVFYKQENSEFALFEQPAELTEKDGAVKVFDNCTENELKFFISFLLCQSNGKKDLTNKFILKKSEQAKKMLQHLLDNGFKL